MNNIVNIIINTLRLHHHHHHQNYHYFYHQYNLLILVYLFIYLFILYKNARRHVSKLPGTHFRNGEEVGGGTEKRANIREVT